jgi:hypothetical protein
MKTSGLLALVCALVVAWWKMGAEVPCDECRIAERFREWEGQ